MVTQSVILQVNPAESAVGLAVNASTAMAQNSVTFTATVSSIAGTPTGSVVFTDGSTTLATVALSGGTATYTTSALATGSHSITAIYGGSSNYTTAASSALAESVLDFTLNPTGSTGGSQTVIPGNTANYTLAIAPTTGTSFPTTATLTVTGLPSGAIATLNTSSWTQLSATSWQVPAITKLSDVSLGIKVPGQTAATRQVEAFGNRVPPVAWGILLLPFVGRLRRAGRRLAGKLAVLLVLAAGVAVTAGLSGCGTQNGFNGQAQQQYTITVTVTTGSLSHATNLTLTVQ
jgi:hypothetical protein